MKDSVKRSMKGRIVLFAIFLFSVLLIALCINNFGTPLVRGGPGTYIGNLHTHTIASDGENTYHEMVRGAADLGLEFLVITDHHTISTATRTYCPNEKRLLCVVGEEISTTEGHIVAVDIDKAIPPGLSAQETIDRIHDQGGMAIAAHLNEPHGYGINQNNLERLVGLDAVEYTPIDKQDWYRNIDLQPGYFYVFDSDAHSTDMLKNVANMCELSNLSIEGLKQAIREGKCEVYFP